MSVSFSVCSLISSLCSDASRWISVCLAPGRKLLLFLAEPSVPLWVSLKPQGFIFWMFNPFKKKKKVSLSNLLLTEDIGRPTNWIAAIHTGVESWGKVRKMLRWVPEKLKKTGNSRRSQAKLGVIVQNRKKRLKMQRIISITAHSNMLNVRRVALFMWRYNVIPVKG